MANPTRTVKVKFDGTAKGLIAAGKQGEHAVESFRKQAEKSIKNIKVEAAGSLIDSLGALPSQLKGAAIVAAVGIGAVMAPALASAIIAGVLLAVGGGVLAAGIVGAAKDQRVVRAWKKFGHQAAHTFEKFSKPFIAPLTRAAETFSRALKRAEPTILAIGRTMAPIIDKLAPGLAGIFEKMLPGIAKVSEASLPFLERLLSPKLGESIGKFLDNIAAGAPSAFAFFDGFMNWVEKTLPKLGGFITWLSDLGVKMDEFVKNPEFNGLKAALNSFKDDTLKGVKEGFDDIKVAVDSNSKSWKELKDNVAIFIEFAGPAFKFLAALIGESVGAAIDWLADLSVWISRILVGLTKIDDLYRRLTGKEVLKSAPKLPGSPGGFQGFASGGFGKGLAVVGERGRELVDLGAGSRVYNNRDTENMLAGAGGPIAIDIYVHDGEVRGLIDARVRESNRGIKRAVLAGAGAR